MISRDKLIEAVDKSFELVFGRLPDTDQERAAFGLAVYLTDNQEKLQQMIVAYLLPAITMTFGRERTDRMTVIEVLQIMKMSLGMIDTFNALGSAIASAPKASEVKH